jgi:hypothetical protein
MNNFHIMNFIITKRERLPEYVFQLPPKGATCVTMSRFAGRLEELRGRVKVLICVIRVPRLLLSNRKKIGMDQVFVV